MLFKLGSVISGADTQSTSKADDGASLTSILDTPVLRIELALLVLLCTDAMRSDLAATFDASRSNVPLSPISPTSSSTKTTEQDLISFDAEDYASVKTSENGSAAAAERAKIQREREIASTQMQGLRRAALTYSDKWRAGVMHRVCDVLGVRGEVVRNAKAKRKAAMEAAERDMQSQSLLDLEEDDLENKAGDGNEAQQGRYPPIKTRLSQFDMPKRVLILHCLLLLFLSLEHYPAHSRVLLLRLASSLHLSIDTLADHEKSVAQGLLASASQMDGDEATKKKAAQDSDARKWKVGLAAVGGAVLIGVTGGLAAPLLAAGVGTVMGGLGLGATVVSGYLGALAGSSVLVGSLFGAYGAKMTGRLMDQYAKEVEDFQFIPIQAPLPPTLQSQDDQTSEIEQQHRLRVAIGVSGWLTSSSDVDEPWDILDSSGIESFALRWELQALINLGTSLTKVAMSYAWEGAKIAIVRRTLLGALYAGLWPLGLVKAASVLDNPFSIAVARSDKAGKVLAHALISKVQGERPVTLVGYSLGARVIFSCLVELAEQNAFGLVESVVLMGAPTPSDSRTWRQIRAVVSARVVNVYSTEDYILGFLYRTSQLQFGVAGLQEVEGVFGVENVNMSKLVTAHDKYRYLVGAILSQIGFEDINAGKVKEQVQASKTVEKKKQQVKEKDRENHREVLFDMEVSQRGIETDAQMPFSPRGPASSSEMLFPTQTSTAQMSTLKSPPSHSLEDSSDEEDHRIVMEDLEDNELPSPPENSSTSPRTTFSPKQTPTVEIMKVGQDDDSDWIASAPIGELTMLEPMPEPEHDIIVVQTN